MKTGRNDPCPCGSGKKYRHCCMVMSGAATAAGNIINFPVSDDSRASGSEMAEILGFRDEKHYEESLAVYQAYCKRIHPEGQVPPTFTQFINGGMMVGGFLFEASVEECMADLYRKGAYVKNKAVSINRSFPVKFLDGIPAVVPVSNLLTCIESAAESPKTSQLLDLDGDFGKDLVNSNIQGLDLSIQNFLSDGSPGIFVLIDLSVACANELNFLNVKNSRVTVSAAGKEFLNGKFLKRSYLKMGKFLEREFDWYYSRFEGDGNLELWYWCREAFPLSLMIFSHLGEDVDPLDSHDLIECMSDHFPLSAGADSSLAADSLVSSSKSVALDEVSLISVFRKCVKEICSRCFMT